MIKNFYYTQPVNIHFGYGKLIDLSSVLDEILAEKL